MTNGWKELQNIPRICGNLQGSASLSQRWYCMEGGKQTMEPTEKGRRAQRVRGFHTFKTKSQIIKIKKVLDFRLSYLNLHQRKLEFLPILLKYARRHKNKLPHPPLVLTRWTLLLTTLLYHLITHQNQRNLWKWWTKNSKHQCRTVAKRQSVSWKSRSPI